MAVTVNRQARPTSATFNQGAQKQDSILYNVDGLDVRALKNLLSTGVGLTGLPKILDPHPELPGLLCRGYRVDPEETGYNADVEVIYATSNVSGTGLLYAVPDRSGGQYTIEATFQDVNVDIPICYHRQKKVGDGSGAVTLDYYEAIPRQVRETRIVLNATWQVGGGTLSKSTIGPFSTQNGKVHTVFGAKRLFRVSSIRARDNLTYTIQASWTLDTGTVDVPSTDVSMYRMPRDLRTVTGTIAFQTGFMRNPYCYIETVPVAESDSPNLGPRVFQHREYVEDLNGWTTLPGVPDLS